MLRDSTFLSRIGFAFLLVGVSLLPACAEQSDDPKPAKSYTQLEQFWPAFRQAALAGDNATLVQLSQFPFATRGLMDDDPVVQLDRKRFEKNINTLLAQDPGDPATNKPETTLDLFKRTTTIKDQGGGFARVGDLVFHRVNGHWLWVKAYIDEAELK